MNVTSGRKVGKSVRHCLVLSYRVIFSHFRGRLKCWQKNAYAKLTHITNTNTSDKHKHKQCHKWPTNYTKGHNAQYGMTRDRIQQSPGSQDFFTFFGNGHIQPPLRTVGDDGRFYSEQMPANAFFLQFVFADDWSQIKFMILKKAKISLQKRLTRNCYRCLVANAISTANCFRLSLLCAMIAPMATHNRRVSANISCVVHNVFTLNDVFGLGVEW